MRVMQDVQVNLAHVWARGQPYVALSRTRKREDVIITGDLITNRMTCSLTGKRYYHKLEQLRSLQSPVPQDDCFLDPVVTCQTSEWIPYDVMQDITEAGGRVFASSLLGYQCAAYALSLALSAQDVHIGGDVQPICSQKVNDMHAQLQQHSKLDYLGRVNLQDVHSKLCFLGVKIRLLILRNPSMQGEDDLLPTCLGGGKMQHNCLLLYSKQVSHLGVVYFRDDEWSLRAFDEQAARMAVAVEQNTSGMHVLSKLPVGGLGVDRPEDDMCSHCDDTEELEEQKEVEESAYLYEDGSTWYGAHFGGVPAGPGTMCYPNGLFLQIDVAAEAAVQLDPQTFQHHILAPGRLWPESSTSTCQTALGCRFLELGSFEGSGLPGVTATILCSRKYQVMRDELGKLVQHLCQLTYAVLYRCLLIALQALHSL